MTQQQFFLWVIIFGPGLGAVIAYVILWLESR